MTVGKARSPSEEILIGNLWDLIDNWRDLANNKVIHLPFLAEHPRSAYSQGLNKAIDELEGILLQCPQS